ncbi:MAG: 3'-5' exonuclease [Actinomycetales bacterium]|nr:3'-5' exonuclease [Actinomycetales bacterium]
MIEDSWVSIDVETAGPDPSTHALLSIGACLAADPAQGFYVELRPDRDSTDPAAMAVHGLAWERLLADGQQPHDAMLALESWLGEHVRGRPVMVGFNAPFDWMFICHYFWEYLQRNPLGHSAIDIKALAMGWLSVPWRQTSFTSLAQRLALPSSLSHHALDDARQQAELLQRLLQAPRPTRAASAPGQRGRRTRKEATGP